MRSTTRKIAGQLPLTGCDSDQRIGERAATRRRRTPPARGKPPRRQTGPRHGPSTFAARRFGDDFTATRSEPSRSSRC